MINIYLPSAEDTVADIVEGATEMIGGFGPAGRLPWPRGSRPAACAK